ncbi:MAG: amino acid permease, partial [Anaerolineae bacterium]
RANKIPGGNLGKWCVAGLGLIGSFFTFFIGFFPPAQIPTGNNMFYVSVLLLSILLACLAPSIILLFKKPEWERPLNHEES